MAFPKVASKTQAEMLMDHFMQRNNISAMEAANMFKIRSLSRRINDLEDRGHVFRRETRTDTTGQRYVRYFWLRYTPTPDVLSQPALEIA